MENKLRTLIFFSLFLLLFFSLHYLFYSRVIKKLLVSQKIKIFLTTLVGINFTFNVLYVIGRYSDIFSNTLYYLLSLSLGTTLVLFLYLILHELLQVFHKTLKNVDLSKRDFIKKSADGTMLALSTSCKIR